MLSTTNLFIPEPSTTPLGVRAYPQSAGVTAGETLLLCVAPGQSFCVAFYVQGATETLTVVSGAAPLVQSLRWVTKQGKVFTSANVAHPRNPDLDWNWPQIGFSIPANWPSAVYFAVVYPVDPATGIASDALGQAVQAGDPNGKIKPHPDYTTSPILCWDNGMALFVVRPTTAQVSAGTAKIAYVLSVSTYQAYNNSGDSTPGSTNYGCYYYDNAVTRVTLRRPGGGAGSIPMSDERDPFDTSSRRNTFAHWDALFIRWLIKNGIQCHFYTNFDLDYYTDSQPSPLMTNATLNYPLMLAVGHDEYWGSSIRAALEAFQQANGNIAIFSGNTCYRPVSFGAASTSGSRFDAPPSPLIPSDQKSIMLKLNPEWPSQPDWAVQLNEASTIGVTFKTGAGSWGGRLRRVDAGYALQAPFIGPIAKSFGMTACVVGYECDALYDNSPANYVVLGTATLSGNQWNQAGKAAMGYFQRNTQAPPNKSILFNAATTDWARLLPLETTTDPDQLLADSMTKSVISRLTG
jgi:hypothetical protein